MKICEETVREALNQAVGGETLSQWDRQRIVRTAERMTRRPAPRWPRRLATAAATLTLGLLCTTGALAAVPGLAESLSMLSKKTVEHLRPVDVECEAAGIRMEVIAAMNDGDTAVAYIGLQDLTGQNRLDATTDTPDCALTDPDWYSVVDNVYPRQDGSVVLRLVGQTHTGQAAGEKVTLAMHHLLSGGRTDCHLDTGYTLADVMALNSAPKLNTGASIGSYDLMASADSKLFRQLESGAFRTLRPAAAEAVYRDDRAPWLGVSNVGVVDGVLHILVRQEEGSWYNSVSFDFADAGGNRLNANNAVLYLGERRALGPAAPVESSEYQEYLLEIPEGYDPAQLRLVCDLKTYEVCIRDNWSLTFTLQQPTSQITVPCSMDMQPWQLTEVQLSPVGVSFLGSGSILENSLMPTLELLMADGTVVGDDAFGACSSSVSEDEQGEETVLLKCLFAEPLDVDAVEAICVNGLSIWSR